MAEPTNNDEFTHPLSVAKLSQTAETPFDLNLTEGEARAVAKQLSVISVRKLRFVGATGMDGDDWVLDGKLGVTVTQSCVVTLEPVRTRIEIDVRRRFTASISEENEADITIPSDDTVEALGAIIDAAQIAIEALALELPEYPRADGAVHEELIFSPPGVEPLTDEAARPFAGLGALKKKLEGNE